MEHVSSKPKDHVAVIPQTDNKRSQFLSCSLWEIWLEVCPYFRQGFLMPLPCKNLANQPSLITELLLAKALK